MKPVTVTWTLEDSRQACKEGWDIFDCSGRYEIERNDEHPGMCAKMNEDEIVGWLMGRALRGNRLAMKALLHLMVVDPGWTAADISSMTKRGHLVARDANKKVVEPASFIEYRKEAQELLTTWEDDAVQFPRMLAELNAAGAPNRAQLKLLKESTGLNTGQVIMIFERAEKAWQKAKGV